MKTTGKAAAAGNVLSLTSGCCKNGIEIQPDPPNVILIMTDDQGYGDLGCHGNEFIQTLNIDQFARNSIEFERFYVCPSCAPTRASLLTGRYHHRTCVQGTMSGEALIHPDEVTMADILVQRATGQAFSGNGISATTFRASLAIWVSTRRSFITEAD